MSAMDDCPDYFARDGKIYRHHEATRWYDVDWGEDSEPAYNQELCDDTPENRKKYGIPETE